MESLKDQQILDENKNEDNAESENNSNPAEQNGIDTSDISALTEHNGHEREAISGKSKSDKFADAKECAIEIPETESQTASVKDSSESSKQSSTHDEQESSSSPISHNTTSSNSSFTTTNEYYGLCCGCAGNFFYDYSHFVRVTFSSPYILPLYLMLMGFPISAGYMGSRYMQDCPSGASVPLFLFLMGLCGVLCLASRMVDIVQHWLFPHSPMWDFPSYTCFFTLVTILLLLITEMMVIVRIEPDFENRKAEDYCNPVFYNFTYYGNFVGFALLGVAFILYLPSLMCHRSYMRLPV